MIWTAQIKLSSRRGTQHVQVTEWDHRLDVRADGKNLIGHLGLVLRRVADCTGLTLALSAALPKGSGPG